MDLDNMIYHVVMETVHIYGDITINSIDRFLDNHCMLSPREYYEFMKRFEEVKYNYVKLLGVEC